jgi:serine phosphatase RsbU (regulator of sigma subunit)
MPDRLPRVSGNAAGAFPHELDEAFRRGGEMGRRMAALDWSRTPVGPPATWTPQLRFAVALLLASKSQVVLFWGPEYVAFYNDAYAPTIGDKHPAALGVPARVHWAELWDDLRPLLDGVVASGEAFHAADRPFYIDRRGFLERVYFDVSYDPVRGSDGAVQGVLCFVSETTRRVLGERRLRIAREVADRIDDVPEDAIAGEVADALVTEDGELAEATVDLGAAGGPLPDRALALPLRSGGRTLGRLVVVPSEHFQLDDGLVTLLQQVADMVARTVAEQRAQHEERERSAELRRSAERLQRVAKILERAILPDRLPELVGASVAGRYMPGSLEAEVGGDWYDVLPLDDDHVALVIGDVVGRGVEAAASMGQLRNALRGFLIGGAGPGEALTSLDRVAHTLPEAVGSTVACALLDLRSGRLTHAAAGHLPPLLVGADGTTTWLESGRALPLGVVADKRHEQAEVQVAPGGTIVLYTDGLVERRDVGITARMAVLAQACAGGHGAPADLVAHAVATLLEEQPGLDDAAILALTLDL